MIKAVIFDSDGMLSHGPRFSDTYVKDHGISMDELTPFFIGPFKDCLVGKADLKTELSKEWIEKWGWKGSVDKLLNYWFSVGDKLDKELFATVPTLRSQGIPVVLATNQEKYRTVYLSKTFGYDAVFDKVFSSAYVGHKKPTPEFFNTVFAYLQSEIPSLSKSEVIFWDDDIENVEGAKNYGFEARQFVSVADFKNEMQKIGVTTD